MMTIVIDLIHAARPLQAAYQSADKIVELDPYGIGMAIIAMSVVFAVLATTYLIFKNISRVYDFVTNRTGKVKAKLQQKQTDKKKVEDVPTEVSAAIAMALHLYYNQQHDLESLKLTIQKVSKIYSPWSSKIYSMRQLPK